FWSEPIRLRNEGAPEVLLSSRSSRRSGDRRSRVVAQNHLNLTDQVMSSLFSEWIVARRRLSLWLNVAFVPAEHSTDAAVQFLSGRTMRSSYGSPPTILLRPINVLETAFHFSSSTSTMPWVMWREVLMSCGWFAIGRTARTQQDWPGTLTCRRSLMTGTSEFFQ